MINSHSSLKEVDMLWLQAIHFQNPLDRMQKVREETIDKILVVSRRENKEKLWFLDAS